MEQQTFTFRDHDNVEVFVYKWMPDIPHKAVVLISHGMQEHALRYARTADALTKAGYIVYAADHLGHGRTALSPSRLGDLGQGGWQSALWDLKQLADRIRRDHPSIPLFLLGHSWGSFLAQAFMQRWGSLLSGAILSGTNGAAPGVEVGAVLAQVVTASRGGATTAGTLEKLCFSGYNKRFKPGKTGREWLCSDAAEVEKYQADPLCGTPFPNSFFLQMFEMLKHVWKPAHEAEIPTTLPIYLFSGTEDPVGRRGKGVEALHNRYRKLGIADVTLRLYPGGRHEMLNEINRDEVHKELIEWLDRHH